MSSLGTFLYEYLKINLNLLGWDKAIPTVLLLMQNWNYLQKNLWYYLQIFSLDIRVYIILGSMACFLCLMAYQHSWVI